MGTRNLHARKKSRDLENDVSSRPDKDFCETSFSKPSSVSVKSMDQIVVSIDENCDDHVTEQLETSKQNGGAFYLAGDQNFADKEKDKTVVINDRNFDENKIIKIPIIINDENEEMSTNDGNLKKYHDHVITKKQADMKLAAEEAFLRLGSI